MRTFPAIAAAATIALGCAVGCDETVSEEKTTDVRSDGSTVEKKETVTKEPDGTLKKEESTEKTPPTNP